MSSFVSLNPMETNNQLIVAAFDFDKTFTDRDTFLPFLFWTIGKNRVFSALFRSAPHLLGYLIGIISRQKLKETILKYSIGGLSERELRIKGKEFALQKIPTFLYPAVLERYHWHRSQGHCCILISGAIDLYLEPWGEVMAFDYTICSRCLRNPKGEITGQLKGSNCWGKEKVRRLTEILGPRDNYLLYVYGDSRGDAELLAAADYPFYRFR